MEHTKEIYIFNRVQALQDEITDVARNFAKERSKLEIAIAVRVFFIEVINTFNRKSKLNLMPFH